MVFGLFSKEKSLQKTVDKAINKLSQQPDRFGALERLRDDGSEDALYGLCKRFGVTSMKAVEDEQEKNWVVDTLVGANRVAVKVVEVIGETAKLQPGAAAGISLAAKVVFAGVQLEITAVDDKTTTVKLGAAAKVAKPGQAGEARTSPHPALAPLIRYMKSAEQLGFPLKVLERVADHDAILSVVDELFASETPGYVRMPERRIDLLRWFSEWKPATDDELVTRLTPYVTDFDENVRFTAIEGMAGRDPAKIAPPLIIALLNPEEESGRIKRTIAEVLEKTKAPLGDKAKEVAAALAGPLANDFKVEAGIVKKR